MDVFVVTEQRFMLYEGRFFAQAAGGESFWRRYLNVFEGVKIIARVQAIDTLPEGAVLTDSRDITIIPLPNYVSWRGLMNLPTLLWHTRNASTLEGAFILRVPGFIGILISFWLRVRQWPYGVEVVGDPFDSLSSQALGKKWADWVRWLAVYQLRRQCHEAVCSAYVTRETLQKRYPPGGRFTTHYSSITLNHDLFEFGAKQYQERKHGQKSNNRHRLIFVGSLSQRYKGLHVLLEALHLCQKAGWNLDLVVLGDGFYRTEYEKLTDSLQLQNVIFRGYLKGGQAIFEQLAEADLFVMPSLVEGLPRAMVEAMACGLPCIGTRIGGIPELLTDEDIVPPGDAPALAEKIMRVLADPAKMQEMSVRNFHTSQEYHPDHLRERRNAFYQFVHDATMDYMSVKQL
jgi:glycosyltransferase involved in cell wall biosynthesis